MQRLDREIELRPLLEGLLRALPDFLANQRWFGGKARAIRGTKTVDAIGLLDEHASPAYIVIVEVRYTDSTAETYALALKFASRESVAAKSGVDQPALYLPGQADDDEIVLVDALWDRDFSLLLLDSLERRRVFRGSRGELRAIPTHALDRLVSRGAPGVSLEPALLKREQSNTSIRYGDRLIMKFFRRLEEGANPDVEIGAFLTERTSFAQVPALGGSFEYAGDGEPVSVAIVQAFVPNQGDAWSYTLEVLASYFEGIFDDGFELEVPRKPLLDLAREAVPARALGVLGGYLDSARLLGRRTAELHLALASNTEDPNFAPEPLSMSWQRIIGDAMSEQSERAFILVRDRLEGLPVPAREQAENALRLQRWIEKRLSRFVGRPIDVARIRIHGDYHLGQVLHASRDFVIIDFEGEPARPLSERRTKRLALLDVAGMLRSFHYAAETARISASSTRGLSSQALRPAARYWQRYVSAAFLQSYFSTAGRAPFLPEGREDLEILLDACLLQKVTYELEYEFNHRPDWVSIPLDGILDVAGSGHSFQ